MEQIFIFFVVAVLMVDTALLAYTLGWFLTEEVNLPLKFKPFTCRPCLTFWFTVVLYFVIALLTAPLLAACGLAPVKWFTVACFTGVGALVGLINYFYIRLKFSVYE